VTSSPKRRLMPDTVAARLGGGVGAPRIVIATSAIDGADAP